MHKQEVLEGMQKMNVNEEGEEIQEIEEET